MKRNELRKSLQKLKKELDSTYISTSSAKIPDHTKYPQEFCTCKDAQGLSKMLYSSKKEAEEASRFSKELNLHIYPCPSENGWHLTKG